MKKLMSILLTLAMLGSLAVVTVSAETTLSTQVGEDGKTYYLIGNADDYVAFVAAANADLSINGKLTADIDMSSVTTTANYIGNFGKNKNVGYDKPYTGTFDGNYHIIKNITLKKKLHNDANAGVAMFNMTSGATIKNLGVENATVHNTVAGRSNSYAGVIIAYGQNTIVENCYVKNSTVTWPDSTEGDYWAYAGIIAGQLAGTSTKVNNCYSVGNSIGYGNKYNSSGGGAFTGFVGRADTGTITNSYAKGTTVLKGGKFCSFSRVSSAFENCYTDSGKAFSTYSCGANVTEEWSTLADKLGSAWKNDTNNLNGGTPMLKWELESILDPSLPFAPDNYDGEGTKEDPFLINNLDDLKTLSKDVKDGYTFTGRYFKLTADIDMHTKDNTEENAWIPIGSSKERSFGGVFDGNGKVIKNVYITKRQGNMGFFGFLYGAEVKNLGIEKIKFEYTNDSDARVSYVGGLAGTINDSTVDSCYVHDFVNINHKDNVNEGHVGPLAGYAYDALVSNCFTVNMTWSGSPDAKVSGFIGSLNGSDSNKTVIKNCYSAGNFVFGAKTKNFWLMGRITKTANVKKAENCYFSHGIPQKKGTSTNNDLGDKGCVKLTDTEMQNAIEGLGAEYRKADGGHENYGYPMLSWMSDVPLEYYPVTIEIVGKGSCEINTSMLKDGNQVAYNSYVSLGIDPAMGYKFKEIFLNGYLIEYDYLPSFKMGRAPALLTLEFEEIEIPDVAPGYIYKHEGISDADVIDDEHFSPASGLINGVFATVPEKGEKTNNVIKVVPQSGSNSNYFNYYPEGGFKFPYSDFTLEYDVYVENIKNSSYVGADSSDISDNVIHKLETTRSDGQHMASFSFIQDEYDEMYAVFEDSESTEKIALKTDIWYHVVMAIDPQSGKHDVNVINRSNGKIAGRLIYTTEKTAQSDKGVGISFHAGYCSDGMPESERNCYYLDNLKYTTNKFYMPDEKAEVTKSGDSVKFSLPTYLNVPSATETRTPVMIASVFDKNGKLLVGADLSKAVLDAQSSEITGSSSAQYENLSGEINVSSLADGKYDVKVFVWFNLFDDNAQVPYFEVLNDSITVSNGSIVSE